ncbi:MAG TPA: hypothetical protein VF411_06875 [Bacteroidia bacterium]
MTTFRIQKTIISKYLDLINQDKATETQIFELFQTINGLYKDHILTDSDCYKQKLEHITSKLKIYLDKVIHKRTTKEIHIEDSKDFLKILQSDLEDIDYSKTNLTDLNKFENEKELAISFDNVKLALENIVVPKLKLKAELNLEVFLHDRLSIIFGKERVYRQYSVGGFLALKTDIDIGNGQVGIELKIADHLTATEMQRMIGQVVYYKKRYYNNNLIVYIASKSSLTATIKELKEFMEELGTTVIFSQAINF